MYLPSLRSGVGGKVREWEEGREQELGLVSKRKKDSLFPFIWERDIFMKLKGIRMETWI